MPTFNAGTFIETCLTNLLGQTYKNIEIIAIDDLSKDDTYKKLLAYKKQDKRLRVFRNKKRYGMAICLNRALRRAKGQFITFVDPQDVPGKLKLKKQLSYLLSHPKVVAAGTQCSYITHKGRVLRRSVFPLEHETIYHALLPGMGMLYETALINRGLLPKDVLYFKANTYPAIYSEVFVKLIQYGEIVNLPDFLYGRRDLHPTQRAIAQYIALFKLWAKATTLPYYQPSLRSLFMPLRGI